MRRVCVEMLGRAASADGAAPIADGDVERIFDSPVSYGVISSEMNELGRIECIVF